MQKSLMLERFKNTYPLKKCEYQTYHRDISNDTSHRIVLKSNLISWQEPQIQKSLTSWSADLNITLQMLYHQKEHSLCAAQVAEIFNQATWIFIASNHLKYAREICYSQIKYFIQGNQLKYVFTPWLNLIRIDRLSGNVCDAASKLQILTNIGLFDKIVGENKRLMYSLHQALCQDARLLEKIRSQSMAEKIKLYLMAQQYSEIITFLDSQQISDVYAQEARMIAYANMGEIDEACNLLQNQWQRRRVNTHPVLALRKCELQIMSASNNVNLSSDMDKLYQISLQLIMNTPPLPRQLGFALHLAHLMRLVNMNQDAIKLSYYCLEAAVELGDEVLKADSIILLYHLLADNEGRSIVEDFMVPLYFHTQYAIVREKLLACFEDLQYVEQQHTNTEMTLLYEDLISFSAS